MGLLNQLTPRRLRVGVRGPTERRIPRHAPTPPRSSEPGAFPGTHVHLISLPLQQPRCLAARSRSRLSFHPAKVHLATGVGLPSTRDAKGAGAYLHADDGVDEEQHGYEQGDIWERLQERKRSAQPRPPALGLLGHRLNHLLSLSVLY